MRAVRPAGAPVRDDRPRLLRHPITGRLRLIWPPVSTEGRVITAQRARYLGTYADQPSAGLNPRRLHFYGHSFNRWRIRRARRVYALLASAAEKERSRQFNPFASVKTYAQRLIARAKALAR